MKESQVLSALNSYGIPAVPGITEGLILVGKIRVHVYPCGSISVESGPPRTTIDQVIDDVLEVACK